MFELLHGSPSFSASPSAPSDLNHALKNASHTASFFLHRQDPFPHTSLSIPCTTQKAEHSSAGLESTIRDPFLWSSSTGNTSPGKVLVHSVDAQKKTTSALCEDCCHSHWGTAIASMLTVASGLHLCTPAVILSTALPWERMPTEC